MQEKGRDIAGPQGSSATGYEQGAIGATGPAYSPPIEQSTEQIGYLRTELSNTQARERKLLNKIKTLTAELARKDSQLTYCRSEKLSNAILNLGSIIFIGIGSGLVGTNSQNMFGWGLILMGIVLYIISIRACIILPSNAS